MSLGFKHTRIACYLGYITQAIVNSFIPLLFLTFQRTYGISLDKIALLVTMNFSVQLMTDAVSPKLIDKVGYRAAIVAAHALSVMGLCLLAILPNRMADPFTGIIVSVVIYAVGGGLLEVLVSPIVEACPSDNKEGNMSLLHSFYCWGVMGVVIIATLFFQAFGIGRWPILALCFALIPLVNGMLFLFVPINTLVGDQEGMKLIKLFKNKVFWLLMVMMICAGASEQAVSQWASAFAESSLHISKSMGDLLGMCMFALLMGTARLLYAKISGKVRIGNFMLLSTGLCVISYIILALNPSPILSLMACGLCGFSVGVMWPGTFSIAAKAMRTGGTALFALLALGGDIGCAMGPTVVGVVSNALNDVLSCGFLVAMVFPVMLIACLLRARKESI